MIILSIVIVSFILVCLFAYLYVEWKDRKDNKIKIKLNEKLVSLCSLFGIPLEYKNDLGDAAGHILFYKDRTGRISLDSCKIEVLEEYKDEPWVLAHEIGHYIAIKNLHESTEEMANQRARELCCTLLSEQEQKELKSTLDIHFKIPSPSFTITEIKYN